MNTDSKKEKIAALLLDYCSNSIPASTIAYKLNASEIEEENICQILEDFYQDWDELICDPEGFTREQDIEADCLIYRAVNQLFEEIEA